jgi:hypothetical protein
MARGLAYKIRWHHSSPAQTPNETNNVIRRQANDTAHQRSCLRRSILKQHHATSITAIISKATNPQAAAESVDHRHPAIIIVLLLLL